MSEFEKELDGILEIIKDEKFYNSKLYALPSIEELKAHFKDWQPSKPLVEVPRIVADYIETQKDNNYNGNAYLIVKHYDSFKYEGNDSELDIWIANNFNDFLNAIVNGYTVKKEQLFYLREKNTDYYLTKSKNHSFLKLVINPYFDENDEFTQSEIDKLNIGSYEQIAVKVDEVEP